MLTLLIREDIFRQRAPSSNQLVQNLSLSEQGLDTGTRHWFLRRTMLTMNMIHLSPAAQFVPYQWVSIWSSLLRNFDFQALDTGERLVGDWLTNTMTDPFVVKIRKLNLD